MECPIPNTLSGYAGQKYCCALASVWVCIMTARMYRAHCVQDTAASYGVGALGGLMYLRLLNRSVDSLAASSLGAAGGQARFAIPVLLVLLYNRWPQLLGACLYLPSSR